MLIIKGFAGFLASVGFALLFNIERKHIILGGIIGGIGSVCYFALFDYGYASEAVAIFFASIFVSLVSEIMARIVKCPTTIFLTCAIIPLVPGGKIYYTMSAFINGTIEKAVFLLIGTIADAGAIVIASAIVGNFIRLINRFSNK